MGMFRRKTAPPAAADLFTESERERVDALWRLTAPPRAEFDAAENAARLAEVMSFALTAAVLADRLGLVVGRANALDWCPLTEMWRRRRCWTDMAVPHSYGALPLRCRWEMRGVCWLGQELVTMRALGAHSAKVRMSYARSPSRRLNGQITARRSGRSFAPQTIRSMWAPASARKRRKDADDDVHGARDRDRRPKGRDSERDSVGSTTARPEGIALLLFLCRHSAKFKWIAGLSPVCGCGKAGAIRRANVLGVRQGPTKCSALRGG